MSKQNPKSFSYFYLILPSGVKRQIHKEEFTHDSTNKGTIDSFRTLCEKKSKELASTYGRRVEFDLFTEGEFETSVPNTEEEDIPTESSFIYDWDSDHNQDDFPRGWKNRKVFVATDGSVYRKGDLQPEEYRTIEPSSYTTLQEEDNE